MADLGAVKLITLNYGATGTSIVLAAATTNTSNPQMMPRNDYSVQITIAATGTSGVGGVIVAQGSNDNLGWVALGSATCTSTQAGTGTTYGAAALTISASMLYSRAVVSVTGTGNASAYVGV